MSDLNTLLNTLGLEHQESNVYLMALSLGTSPASIIGKRCNIPRSTARYTCEQLVKKQLMVVTQKGNTMLFTAENPEKLKKLLDLQREQIDVRAQKLDVAMQDLKRLFNPYTVMPKMRFYEGVDGLIEMFEDVIDEKAPLFGAANLSEDIHPEILRYIGEKYAPKRNQAGNPAWMLFNDNERTKEYQKKDAEMNRMSLLLPLKDYPFPSCFHIYGNKVAFYSYNKNDMTGVMIENTIIRETQMSIFRMAWEYAKKMEINKKYAEVILPKS